MANTETNASVSPAEDRVRFPLWYNIMVCVGSAWIGGFFGSYYGTWGVAFSAGGGLAVAMLWLNRVGKFQTESDVTAILGGMWWGAIVGVLNTLWMHLTAWGLRYEYGDRKHLVHFQGALTIGIVLGVIAGAIYGLFCMIVLQVYRSSQWRGQA